MVTEPGNGEKRSVNLGDPEQLFAALLAELQQQGARIDALNSVAESLAETDSGAAETVKAIGLLLHTQTFVLAALLGAVRQDDNQIALMSYMMLLNAGILGIAAFKRWTLWNYLGFSFTWLLFSGWYAT